MKLRIPAIAGAEWILPLWTQGLCALVFPTPHPSLLYHTLRALLIPSASGFLKCLSSFDFWHTRAVGKVSSHVKKGIYWRRYKIQETLYIGQWRLSPLQVWGTLGPHTVFPITISCPVAPSHFAESHWRSEISSLSKVISVLGKARSHRAPNLGCSRGESPGWFDVLPKHYGRGVMHEWARCRDEAACH